MKETARVFSWWSLIALVIVGRFMIEPRLDIPTLAGSYEAFAHLVVGALIGVWLGGRKGDYPDALLAAIGLTLFEVVMFSIQKF